MWPSGSVITTALSVLLATSDSLRLSAWLARRASSARLRALMLRTVPSTRRGRRPAANDVHLARSAGPAARAAPGGDRRALGAQREPHPFAGPEMDAVLDLDERGLAAEMGV